MWGNFGLFCCFSPRKKANVKRGIIVYQEPEKCHLICYCNLTSTGRLNRGVSCFLKTHARSMSRKTTNGRTNEMQVVSDFSRCSVVQWDVWEISSIFQPHSHLAQTDSSNCPWDLSLDFLTMAFQISSILTLFCFVALDAASLEDDCK